MGSEALTAERLLELARSQIGVKEEPRGSNRVKYNTAYYGTEVQGSAYPWCCAFQWWLFRQAGAGRLFYDGGRTAHCETLYRFYQKRGQEVDKGELRPGDLVFFNFSGGTRMEHIGICEGVEPGYVVTIDGNTGDDERNGGVVARKRRSLRYVKGAARPDYEEDEEMKVYQYAQETPEWAREAVVKAIRNGYVRMDETGAMSLWEVNLQPLVWMDRAGLLDRPGKEG
ncbi:MAG: CHAP domain-containing protein [Oscillospiraceae bacterium]|nr:CHAP domain-containing protein [Oscillospiraceae bacterium]